MKKYLIAGDVHWSQYSSIVRRRGNKYSVRLHNLLKSINYIEKFAVDNNCDGVIYLGDFFDRSECNAEEITALQDIKWANISHDFIVGNHESNLNTLEYSTTKFFTSVGATIYDSLTRVTINDKVDFYFVPYIKGDVPLLENVIVDKNKKNIVLSHNDVAGLQYGKFISQTGFSIEDIKNNCTLFLNGHLHNEQIIDKKIILVGNLTGQNFTEDAFNFRHVFYTLTIEDDGVITLDQHENIHAMNFYKMKIETEEDIHKLHSLKQNSVVSINCLNTLVDNVSLELTKSSNILEHKLTLFYNTQTSESGDIEIIKYNDPIKQFIDYVQTKLEPSPVLSEELSILGGLHADKDTKNKNT